MTRPILNSEAFAGPWEKLALREVQTFHKPFNWTRFAGRWFAIGMLGYFVWFLGRVSQ